MVPSRDDRDNRTNEPSAFDAAMASVRD